MWKQTIGTRGEEKQHKPHPPCSPPGFLTYMAWGKAILFGDDRTEWTLYPKDTGSARWQRRAECVAPCHTPEVPCGGLLAPFSR